MNIMKSYKFCYAHRVWNQVLSTGVLCKCRYCHGHSGKIDLVLTGDVKNGMIIDFNELRFIKEFIDTVIDHHFLCDLYDPLVSHYFKLLKSNVMCFEDQGLYKIVNRNFIKDLDTELQEFGESFVFINGVPTAENLATWVSTVITELMSKNTVCQERNVQLVSLKWWESDTSYAEWTL
jgi:6-pyruvoyltetrahydropterin/6-carboxytetrahydropterin synthase